MTDCFPCVTENMYNKRKLWIKGVKYMFSDEMLKAPSPSLKPQNAAADVSSRFTLIVEYLGQQISQPTTRAQYREMETIQLK